MPSNFYDCLWEEFFAEKRKDHTRGDEPPFAYAIAIVNARSLKCH